MKIKNQKWVDAFDTERFIRAELERIRIELVPEVLVYRRLPLGNMSRKDAKYSRLEHLSLFKEYRDELRGSALWKREAGS